MLYIVFILNTKHIYIYIYISIYIYIYICIYMSSASESHDNIVDKVYYDLAGYGSTTPTFK